MTKWKPDETEAVKRLTTLHKKLGISQEEHAVKAGFVYGTFRRWIKKERPPRGEYLKALVRYLDGVK